MGQFPFSASTSSNHLTLALAQELALAKCVGYPCALLAQKGKPSLTKFSQLNNAGI
jgi:hypothetical protein